MVAIREESQLAAPGALVELFTLDLTPIGVNSIYRWSNSIIDGGTGPNLVYGGVTYIYRDIRVVDIEVTGNSQPAPRLSMGNIGNIIGALATQNGDLVGAMLTRVVTYRHHLDDGTDPQPNENYGAEKFEIKQKTSQNKRKLEFELGPLQDITDVQLPRRVCMAKVCFFRYRTFNATTSSFDYSKATCPFTGATNGGLMYKPDGTVTAVSSEDLCGKDPRGCSLRFPNQTLPYGGYPGMET